MKQEKKFYVMISYNGKTVCEDRRGYSSKEEAEKRAKMWADDGFGVEIKKI